MTLYSLQPPPPIDLYRCRNTHTIAPLFPIYSESGDLQTDPQPIDSVPPAHFWRNSDGYGFDLRNLAVLLQTNFRNLNPHTVSNDDTVGSGHLWCNQNDLSFLLQVLPMTIHTLISTRMEILNLFSDEMKRKLANLASELCSFTYEGLYEWLQNVPNDVLLGMAVTSEKTDILMQIFLLSNERRTSAIQGIIQHTGIQANQHFAEPAGVERSSDLYRLMEYYKANVVQDFIAYLSQVRRSRILQVSNYDASINEYMQTHFLLVCHRYTTVLKSRPRHFSKMLLWHWIFKITRSGPTSSGFFLLIRGRRARVRDRHTQEEHYVHIRVFFDIKSSTYIVHEDAVEMVFMDTADLWQYTQTLLKLQGSELQMGALAGGIYDICLGKSWAVTLKTDNSFIRTMALLLTYPTGGVLGFLNSSVENRRDIDPLATFRAILGPFQKIGYRIRGIINDFLHSVDYSDLYINKIVMQGGYDNGPATLINKLQSALQGFTCVQDIGSELCEFLSVPYAPERPEFAAFQVNHTGIPPPFEFPY